MDQKDDLLFNVNARVYAGWFIYGKVHNPTLKGILDYQNHPGISQYGPHDIQ